MRNSTGCADNKSICYVVSNNVVYTLDEVCPVCGKYSVDGEVCTQCQIDYNVYKPKNVYEI